MSAYWLIVVPLLVVNLAVLPHFVFLLAISLAAIIGRRRDLGPEDASSRFLIVIPAHDEESGVAMTVRSCLDSNYPSLFFGVAVIADNCTDRTAELARAVGARVVERFNSDSRSKGYAIEYFLDSIQLSGELDSLDALIIIDADTTIDPELLRSFDRAVRQGNDWIQAYYAVANPDESWRTRLMTYAFSLYNGVMPLGQNALGSSAGFKGNGMCFSSRGLRRRPWRSYGLVEDMEYSWTLRVAGEKIVFVPEALLHGAMPGSGGQAAADQRRRWEFGRGEIRKKYLGPLLRSAELRWREKALAACELTIPAMACLALIYVTVVTVDAIAWFGLLAPEFPLVGGFSLTCGILMTFALATYAISPFLAMRLPWRYLSAITLFPFYLGWKLLISLRGRPEQWIRTAREPNR